MLNSSDKRRSMAGERSGLSRSTACFGLVFRAEMPRNAFTTASRNQGELGRSPRCFGIVLVTLVCFVATFGCSTYSDRLKEVRAGYFNGDLVFARRAIDEGLKKPGNDRDVLLLERAMLELAEGKPREAERTLRTVRDRFDELEEASLAEGALSMLSDDNAKSYAGEDYEKVLIRAMLAVTNLMTDGQDAQAYALQTIDKQNQIIENGKDPTGENPKLAYQRVAFGPYVQGILREATHNNYDDCKRATELVCLWEPAFKYGAHDLQRAWHGKHSNPGNGVLYVFAFVGAGPYKIETVEVPTQLSLLVADRILSNNLNQTLPPTIAPIEVPKVITVDSAVTNVRVSVDQHPVGHTETVTDIGRLAVQQYDAVYPQVIARAVARRVVKKGIVYGAKEAVGVDKNSLGGFAFDVAGVVWEATEAADTRCWGLLPDKIQVLRVELPAGQHQVALRPVGLSTPGNLGVSQGLSISQREVKQSVTISNGYNSYMLINCPSLNPVGKVLVSHGSAELGVQSAE